VAQLARGRAGTQAPPVWYQGPPWPCTQISPKCCGASVKNRVVQSEQEVMGLQVGPVVQSLQIIKGKHFSLRNASK